MKKIFFFLECCFLFVDVSYADTMKHFEVLNGKLSIPFDSNVNYYTVYLVDGQTSINANYSLNGDYDIDIVEDNEKAIYNVMDNDKVIEVYTFYKNIDSEPVFKEVSSSKEEVKEIPHLKSYVIGGCFVVILLLFKVIVIGFRKS